MDYHDLQQKLFELDPSDPREDLAKLQQAAQGGGQDVPPAKDYVNETAQITEGSLPLGMDSIADFAALAGVRLDEKQKHGDYARGKDKMPKAKAGRTDHPLKDKLVGEDDEEDKKPNAFQRGFNNAQKGGKYGPDAAGNFVKSAFTGSNDNTSSDSGDRKSGIASSQYNAFLKLFDKSLKVLAADKKLQKKFQRFIEREVEPTLPKTSESIKERLMRELKNKGL